MSVRKATRRVIRKTEGRKPEDVATATACHSCVGGASWRARDGLGMARGERTDEKEERGRAGRASEGGAAGWYPQIWNRVLPSRSGADWNPDRGRHKPPISLATLLPARDSRPPLSSPSSSSLSLSSTVASRLLTRPGPSPPSRPLPGEIPSHVPHL